jgi:hypothetical protein
MKLKTINKSYKLLIKLFVFKKILKFSEKMNKLSKSKLYIKMNQNLNFFLNKTFFITTL